MHACGGVRRKHAACVPVPYGLSNKWGIPHCRCLWVAYGHVVVSRGPARPCQCTAMPCMTQPLRRPEPCPGTALPLHRPTPARPCHRVVLRMTGPAPAQPGRRCARLEACFGGRLGGGFFGGQCVLKVARSARIPPLSRATCVGTHLHKSASPLTPPRGPNVQFCSLPSPGRR